MWIAVGIRKALFVVLGTVSPFPLQGGSAPKGDGGAMQLRIEATHRRRRYAHPVVNIPVQIEWAQLFPIHLGTLYNANNAV